LKTHPKLGDVLSLSGGLIDNDTMQRLNFEVDGKKRRTAEVVEEFLKVKGFLKRPGR
jgi:glycine betaine/choline ABC-type transport system substrate-binding protein